METFVAAYLIVWLAVVLYVGRLHTRQRRLERALEALQLDREGSQGSEGPTSKAA